MRRGTLGVADGLSLAAAPAFGFMALLTAVHGPGPAATLCLAAGSGSLLGGMIPMYLLMSVIHAAPWLRLIAARGRRSPAAAP